MSTHEKDVTRVVGKRRAARLTGSTASHNEVIRCKTAGYSVTDDLAAEPGPSRCGNIHDGVALWHDRNGAWVIAYRDLIRIATAAATRRGLALIESPITRA